MTERFAQIPHKIWEIPMAMEERTMLFFLLCCESKFNKDGRWFELTDEDFVKFGFGKNVSRWKKYRNNLIAKGLIEYKQGFYGRKSEYRVNNNINKVLDMIPTLSKDAEEFIDNCGTDWVKFLNLIRKAKRYKNEEYKNEALNTIKTHLKNHGVVSGSDLSKELFEFANLITEENII